MKGHSAIFPLKHTLNHIGNVKDAACTIQGLVPQAHSDTAALYNGPSGSKYALPEPIIAASESPCFHP